MALSDKDFRVGLLVTPDLSNDHIQRLVKNPIYSNHANQIGEVIRNSFAWRIWWPTLDKEDLWSPQYLNKI